MSQWYGERFNDFYTFYYEVLIKNMLNTQFVFRMYLRVDPVSFTLFLTKTD